MKFINRLRAWFSTEARTVGLSPKILSAPIAALIAAGLNKLGVTPQDLADAFGTTSTVIVGAELFIAGLAASWLLPPGVVVEPAPAVGPGSDAALPHDELVDAPLEPDAGMLSIEAALALLIVVVAVVILLRAFS